MTEENVLKLLVSSNVEKTYLPLELPSQRDLNSVVKSEMIKDTKTEDLCSQQYEDIVVRDSDNFRATDRTA